MLATLSSITSRHEHLRTRIAPTPSGFLHFGNAFSFVLTWLIARKFGGTLRLRIDDIDLARKRPEYVEDIFQSLAWLGLDYDEGPSGPSEFEKLYSQLGRLDRYEVCMNELRNRNEVFACACTRSSIQRESQDGLHPVSCRAKNTDLHKKNVSWRVVTNDAPVQWTDADHRRREVDLHSTIRDFVIRRKDCMPAYQIASLVDDVDFGINFIVRGEDLLESTAAQLWLANRLGEASFSSADFLHHEILVDGAGGKLSKSAGSTSLRAMREADSQPAKLYQRLSPHLGLSDVIHSAEEALAIFAGL